MPGIRELINRPWTVQGPTFVQDDGCDYWRVTVAELPHFLLATTTQEEARAEYLPALEAYLEAMIESGRPITLPPVGAPWGRRIFAVGRIENEQPAEVVIEVAPDIATAAA